MQWLAWQTEKKEVQHKTLQKSVLVVVTNEIRIGNWISGVLKKNKYITLFLGL